MSWSVNDVMPENDGLRIWRFWKRRQLGVDCGPVELVVYWGPVQLIVEWGPVELESWLGPCRALKLSKDHGVEKLKSDHGVQQISIDRDLKHYGMRSVFVGSNQAFGSFAWIEWLRKTFKNSVSLSSCRRSELRSQEVNKRSYLNNVVASVFEFALYFCICICTVVIDMVMGI